MENFLRRLTPSSGSPAVVWSDSRYPGPGAHIVVGDNIRFACPASRLKNIVASETHSVIPGIGYVISMKGTTGSKYWCEWMYAIHLCLEGSILNIEKNNTNYIVLLFVVQLNLHCLRFEMPAFLEDFILSRIITKPLDVSSSSSLHARSLLRLIHFFIDTHDQKSEMFHMVCYIAFFQSAAYIQVSHEDGAFLGSSSGHDSSRLKKQIPLGTFDDPHLISESHLATQWNPGTMRFILSQYRDCAFFNPVTGECAAIIERSDLEKAKEGSVLVNINALFHDPHHSSEKVSNCMIQIQFNKKNNTIKGSYTQDNAIGAFTDVKFEWLATTRNKNVCVVEMPLMNPGYEATYTPSHRMIVSAKLKGYNNASGLMIRRDVPGEVPITKIFGNGHQASMYSQDFVDCALKRNS